MITLLPQFLPAPALVNLQPGKPRLVAHLLAARHPIAEVDERKPRLPRDIDVIKDHMGTQTKIRKVRIVKRINQTQPVIKNIRQTNCRQRPPPFPRIGRPCIFNDPAADRRFLNHRGEFKDIHIRHPTFGVAIIKVPPEQAELIFRRPRAGRVPYQFGGPVHNFSLGSRRHKIRHPDPRRKTGRTLGTRGAIKHILAAPEPLF